MLLWNLMFDKFGALLSSSISTAPQDDTKHETTFSSIAQLIFSREDLMQLRQTHNWMQHRHKQPRQLQNIDDRIPNQCQQASKDEGHCQFNDSYLSSCFKRRGNCVGYFAYRLILSYK